MFYNCASFFNHVFCCMKNDILLINKPINWTSFDVVKKIRNQIKPSKVGHAGTLDPFAEGVLMLCTGHFTKKVESYMNLEKEYIANITFGFETDTLDLTGKIVNQGPNPVLNKNKIEKILPNFIGTIKQKPPMFSALKLPTGVSSLPFLTFPVSRFDFQNKLATNSELGAKYVSLGVPSWIMQPWFMTKIRSAINIASSGSCVTINVATPAARTISRVWLLTSDLRTISSPEKGSSRRIIFGN